MSSDQQQYSAIIQRFPNAKLSYETVAHKKVSPETHPIGILIPQAKKCFVWFTYDSTSDICLLMELNRDMKFSAIHRVLPITGAQITKWSLGTVLYGSYIPVADADVRGSFIIEDICFSKGVNLEKQTFSKKLGFIHEFLVNIAPIFGADTIRFAMPVFFENDGNQDKMNISMNTGLYTIHHIQYRSLTTVEPFYNVFVDQWGKTNLGVLSPGTSTNATYRISLRDQCNFGLPQYKQITTFRVSADLQNDIYHLYCRAVATSNGGKPRDDFVYSDVAYIPNYKTSVYMNAIFRKIRENQNLDNIEESDDEEDFQDVREDKYVDLDKIVYMECAFHTKFQRWVPVGTTKDATKVAVINRLIQQK